MEKSNFDLSKYFIETTYKSGNREYKCYLCTKMGCEMLGNKLQGEKGILFTAKYVNAFNDMQDALLAETGYATIEEYFGEEWIYVVGYEEEFKAGKRISYKDFFIDYNQNQESVNKYGGFYIARFEAGDGITTSARTSSTSDANTLVSKKGAYVYNYIAFENSTQNIFRI